MNDNIEIKTTHKLKQLDITPEEFYGNTDSIYLRCQYIPESRGFKILIFNQIKTEVVNEDLIFMATVCRGMAEAALTYPADIYNMGIEAQNRDVEEMKSTLSTEQKELFDVEPEGSA